MSKYLSPKSNKKSIATLVSLILILTISVGGTLAYLITSTQEVKNTFTPAKNEIEIEEDFDNNEEKKNVGVKNKSDFPVFVRIQFVETWMKDGKIVVTPDGVTVNYPAKNSGWVQYDGFWYYTQPVKSGETQYLYGKENGDGAGITVTKYSNDITAKLNLEVLAQSVQAEPIEAVQELWGVNPTNLVNKEG